MRYMALRSCQLIAQEEISARIVIRRNASLANTLAKVQTGDVAVVCMSEPMELTLWKWLAVSIRKETSS
jgi:hypothetical protein